VTRAPITWADHEAWLADFLDPLGDDETSSPPLLVCFAGDDATWIVDSRRERPDEPVDPLTELSVVAAELAPDRAVIAMPVRVRDLATHDHEVAARVWLLTSIVTGREGYLLRARMLPNGGLGRASDLDIEMSPVASVLDDAVRHRLGEEPTHILYTAGRWGHGLFAAGVEDADIGPRADATDGRSGSVAVTAAEAARHRLQRHARDLAARHRPTGGWERARHRPAVHASTPDGWEAACPV
jgi:hypothetical protein